MALRGVSNSPDFREAGLRFGQQHRVASRDDTWREQAAHDASATLPSAASRRAMAQMKKGAHRFGRNGQKQLVL